MDIIKKTRGGMCKRNDGHEAKNFILKASF